MTDKTLGAYQRHEKHDAADFAKAEFARHPDGRVAARMVPKDDAGHQWLIADADATDLTGQNAVGRLDQYMDSGMARCGWSPVRECPDPDMHRHGVDWQAVAERQEEELGDAIRAHTDSLAMAALWKETARRAVQRQAFLDSAAVMEQEVAISESLVAAEAIRRAEKAEKERDEADHRTAEAEEQRDQWKRHHDRVDGQWAKAEREVTKLRAAEPRPLTPDDITDEMVERAMDAFCELDSDGETPLWACIKEALTAALTAPGEDPEVVALADVLGDFAIADEHNGTRNDMVLARRLHERGVRVEGSGR